MFDKIWGFLLLSVTLVFTATATPAEKGQFPYKVAIMNWADLSDVKLMCGGALIREDTVLTGATCMRHDDIGAPKIEDIDVIGGSEKLDPKYPIFRRYLTKITIHEKYETVKFNSKYNIAILTLSERVPVSGLPFATISLAQTVPSIGSTCLSTVWPKPIDAAWEEVFLHFYRLPIQNITLCDKNLSGFNSSKDSVLCTGYDVPDFNWSFLSDEGGPLICNDQLAGIASVDKWLPQETFGGAFVDVTKYTEWIERNTFEGRLAKHGDYPHLVYISGEETLDSVNLRQNLCVGTLIDADTVVTTALCAGIGNSSKVIIGAVKTPGINFEGGELIKEARMHWDFNLTTLANNIGIIKLAKSVTGIKFPSLEKEKIDTNCIAVGFGSNGRLEDLYKVKRLLEVDLALYDEKYCSSVYPDNSNISRICAGDPGRLRNFCEGDFGGPLFCNGIFRGMYSYGKSCTDGPLYPAVYTDIADYTDWINSSWKISANVSCIVVILLSVLNSVL